MPYVISVDASLLHLYLMHCIILLLAHVCSYTLDHAEPELEELTEQAQVEEFTNLAWIEASVMVCDIDLEYKWS
jgi:hypothetical protein